jgi:hypothetical protein
MLVLGFYTWTARPNVRQMYGIADPAEAYYNQLVEGLRSGQLNLKRETPPGLLKLADPYDPVANASYREGGHLHDTVFYKGKLYLYFGVTPALVLFWPYAALTGHYLYHKQAAAIFCVAGYLLSVALLCAIRRRYFSEIDGVAVAAGALALGLLTCVPPMLQRPEVYEVAISCAYAMVMLSLVGIWRALHDPARRCCWLAVASLAYGLAVGARPTVLFGAVILMAPVVHAWLASGELNPPRWLVAGRALTAAVVPISFIGLGLLLYNYLRFDSPWEFGQHYQMSGKTESEMKHLFGLKYLWFNFRVYFLQPVRWGAALPLVQGIEVPATPAGQAGVDGPFGVLSNSPLVWTALAATLVWQKRTAGERLVLRLFIAALALFFVFTALANGVFAGACLRYEVDFVPVLVLLAVCGIFGLERALAAKPRLRIAVRWIWVGALLFSVTVNLLMSVQRYATELSRDGIGQLHLGRPKDAVVFFERSLQLNSNDAITHYYFAIDLVQTGRLSEAINQYEQALQINPGYPGAREGLAQARRQLAQPSAVPAK